MRQHGCNRRKPSTKSDISLSARVLHGGSTGLTLVAKALQPRARTGQSSTSHLSLQALGEPSAGPDNAADHVDAGELAVWPSRISCIVAGDGERALTRVNGQALHQQRII